MFGRFRAYMPAAFFLAVSFAQSSSTSRLYVVKQGGQGGKSGYIDREGRIVIPPIFSDADDFSEGLAAFLKEGPITTETADTADRLWGYIDETGKEVIKPVFFYGAAFSEGLAPALVDRLAARGGYIDREGNWAIPPKFKEVNGFREGRALVRLENGARAFIDRTGRVIVGPEVDANGNVIGGIFFTYSFGFQEGLAPVRIPQVSRRGESILIPEFWGYIDVTGKMVIAPRFADARPFSQGLAEVSENGIIGIGKSSCIDKTGKIVVKGACGAFSEGLAAAKLEQDQYGDTKDIRSSIPSTLSSGAPAISVAPSGIPSTYRRIKAGRWGYIDMKGTVAIKASFEDAGMFSEGLAAVKTGGAWGYIDQTGKMVIQPQFAAVGSFRGGLAKVWFGDTPPKMPRPDLGKGKMAYINRAGRVIWRATE